MKNLIYFIILLFVVSHLYSADEPEKYSYMKLEDKGGYSEIKWIQLTADDNYTAAWDPIIKWGGSFYSYSEIKVKYYDDADTPWRDFPTNHIITGNPYLDWDTYKSEIDPSVFNAWENSPSPTNFEVANNTQPNQEGHYDAVLIYFLNDVNIFPSSDPGRAGLTFNTVYFDANFDRFFMTYNNTADIVKNLILPRVRVKNLAS